jgi:uncharacterized membrane protein YhhN
MRRTIVLTVSVLAAAAYLISPHPPSTVLKGLSVSLLAVVALASGRKLLATALLLSSLGDVLLDLSARLFVAGLAAFLAAHLVYIVLFVRHRRAAQNEARRYAVLAALLAYGVAFGAWLWPGLGPLRIPVMVYMTAILAMVWTATRAGYRSHWVMAGALLFLLSDSMLGANKFRMAIPGHGFLVWTTYYLGQWLLAEEGG